MNTQEKCSEDENLTKKKNKETNQKINYPLALCKLMQLTTPTWTHTLKSKIMMDTLQIASATLGL